MTDEVNIDQSQAVQDQQEPADAVIDNVETGESHDQSVSEEQEHKGGFQKRIDKLTRRVKEKDEEAKYWREQAMRGSQQATNRDAQEQVQPVQQQAKPKLEEFEDIDQYIDAVAEWKVTQTLAEQERKAAEAKARSEQEQVMQSWTSRLRDAETRYSDFADVLEESTAPSTPAMQQAIVESEVGADILYQLAKNPDEAARIAKLSPLAAAREIGKLEASILNARAKPEQKPVSKAPAPISPVNTASASVEKHPDEMSQREFEAWRNQQLRKRR